MTYKKQVAMLDLKPVEEMTYRELLRRGLIRENRVLEREIFEEYERRNLAGEAMIDIVEELANRFYYAPGTISSMIVNARKRERKANDYRPTN